MTISESKSDVESQRIVNEYEDRARRLPADYYSLTKSANLFIHQSHERALVRALATTGISRLEEKTILETGCGNGNWLSVWESLGAARNNLAGIELGADRAELAQRRLPGADVRAGDATRLPWPDQSFDIVFHRMMFSSILSEEVRHAAAQEQLRVVRPKGCIVWLDFFYNNPHNQQVRGISRRQIRALYPGRTIRFWQITLAPPVVRRLVDWSWTLCEMLQSLRLLNTYYLAVIQTGE